MESKNNNRGTWSWLTASRETDAHLALREAMTRTVLTAVCGITAVFTLVAAAGLLAGIIPADTLLILLLIFLISVISWLLLLNGHWRSAGVFSPLLIFIAAVYGNYIGGIDAPAMLLYVIVVMLAGITYGARHVVPVAAACASALLAVGFAHHAEIIHPLRSGETAFYNRITIILLSIVSIALLIRLVVVRFQQALTESIKNMVKNLELAEKNEALFLQARVEIERRTLAEEKLREKNQELEVANEDLQAALEELDAGNEELARTYREVHEAEERFRRMAESIHEGLTIVESGKIVYMNRRLPEILGQPAGKILDMTVTDFIAPEERERLDREREKIAAGGSPGEIEFWIIRGDGTRRYLHNRYSFDRSGSPGRYYIVTSDITERKAVEEAVMRERDFSRTLIQQSPAFFVAIGTDGRTKMMNQTMLQALGYAADEVEGTNFIETFVPRAEHDLLREIFRDINEKQTTTINENSLLTKSGRQITAEWHGCPVIGKDGGTLYFFGLGIDITDRKRNEKLITIQHEMALALGGTDDLDRALSIVMDACLQIEGIDSGGIYLVDPEKGGLDLAVTRHLSDEFVRLESHYDSESPNTVLVMKGYPVYMRYYEIIQTLLGHAPDGARESEGLKSLAVVPIKDRFKVSGCINIGSHVTEEIPEYSRRSIESIASQVAGVITRLRVEREVRNSLSEKNMLLKEIHHRVKNNMQVIISLIQLQLDRLRDPSDRELIGSVRTSVRSMALIHEKLYRSHDFSRIDMEGYVRDLAEEIFRFNPAAGRISAVVNIGNVMLGIDEAIPCGLIINELITNSLKHAFPGDRKGLITIDFTVSEGKRLLRLHDDGVGLPGNIDHGRPSSLGLQLVGALVNQLGGIMKVEREAGTSYIITF